MFANYRFMYLLIKNMMHFQTICEGYLLGAVAR